MSQTNKYSHYNAEDFIHDEFFQDWVFGVRQSGAADFWESFLTENPAKRSEIEKARLALEEIPFEAKFKELEPAEAKIRESYHRISEELDLKKAGSGARISSISRVWWAAAASVAIIIAGYLFIQPLKKNQSQPDLVKKAATGDIEPGGNKAVLILADGSTVLLDSASTGLITEEGSATIVKLNSGEIAYNASSVTGREVRYNTLQTPRGGQYQLSLPDGSKVWLNSNSSIRFPNVFINQERRVEITGEAYFEVARDSKMPFIVESGTTSVRVLGTRFNMKAYNDDPALRVSLVEGSVDVATAQANSVLKPGQQASVQDNGNIRVASAVNMDEVMAWKEGLFYFDDTELPDLMKQLARWYDVDVVYEGAIPDKKFTGKIYMDVNLSEVLKVLEALKVQFKIEGKKIIVN